MFTTILSALLPVVLTMLLGYFAGRRHDFAPEQADILNRLVLLYALPADLFVGMATTKRSNLAASVPLIVTVVSAIALSYAVTFAISRKTLHKSPGTSALYALAVSGPSVAFVGNSVLGYLYGQQESAIPISIATLALN
jgi:predicted permease